MLIAVTFLTILDSIPFGLANFQTCVPNTRFQWNDRVCYCDNKGRWSDATCHIAGRRQGCLPGQIITENCTQCICQENGQLSCTHVRCDEDSATPPANNVFRRDYFEASGSWCTPFRSYYINCSLCVCPASGRASEASCATDKSCSIKSPPFPSNFSVTAAKNVCIPKVMYLFPCLHCLCSDDGYFTIEHCVETCHKAHERHARRCIPKTFYRKECNICRCPDNSIPNDELCTKTACPYKTKFKSLGHLRNKISSCSPHTFTKPKCFYCNCNSEGKVNENACLELDCLKIYDFKYDFEKFICSPGEMVPICMQCFCLRSGITDERYCTEVCSIQSKLNVLENILEESIRNNRLIKSDIIKKATVEGRCDPNSLYLDKGRYCLCPDNGSTNFTLCTSVMAETRTSNSEHAYILNTISIDFNVTCEPNSFVEFDCNTCYCARNGRIDAKWCTYDDCISKKVIQETYKTHRAPVAPVTNARSNETCTPGVILKMNCNFCICPESGFVKDRACTKNDCTGVDESSQDDAFLCEPLAYYVVDCNICFCPRDGIKNLAKCTKNQCEKNFLRSDVCVAGDLFSDDCNVCVCPPNGDKSDKACTTHICSDADTPWQKIFKLSQNLLGNKIAEETTRSLDLCFPGEEFEVGCNVCICPDMGLSEYATCIPMLCGDRALKSDLSHQIFQIDANEGKEVKIRSRREGDSCMTYNLTDSSERKECTPGSIYIIRCRQCICPYMGNINHFCRALPKGTYCEQAFPYFNYLPMGRRIDDDGNTTTKKPPSASSPEQITINHNHTKYTCEKPGKMMDRCHICECENDTVIEEHCFKSDAANCSDVTPTFLTSSNRIV